MEVASGLLQCDAAVQMVHGGLRVDQFKNLLEYLTDLLCISLNDKGPLTLIHQGIASDCYHYKVFIASSLPLSFHLPDSLSTSDDNVSNTPSLQ